MSKCQGHQAALLSAALACQAAAAVTVETYCYVLVCKCSRLAARGALVPMEGEGVGHIVSVPRLQPVFYLFVNFLNILLYMFKILLQNTVLSKFVSFAIKLPSLRRGFMKQQIQLPNCVIVLLITEFYLSICYCCERLKNLVMYFFVIFKINKI